MTFLWLSSQPSAQERVLEIYNHFGRRVSSTWLVVADLGVGDQQIITYNLILLSHLAGYLGIVLPVVFVKWVFNGYNLVLCKEWLVQVLESISRNLLLAIIVLKIHKIGQEIDNESNVLDCFSRKFRVSKVNKTTLPLLWSSSRRSCLMCRTQMQPHPFQWQPIKLYMTKTI